MGIIIAVVTVVVCSIVDKFYEIGYRKIKLLEKLSDYSLKFKMCIICNL